MVNQHEPPKAVAFGGLSYQKKPRRVCRPRRQIGSKLFSAGAHPRAASLAPLGQFTFCTWQKTLLRLQVWNLSPIRGQIMRAADCQSLSEQPAGIFRQSPPESGSFRVFSMVTSDLPHPQRPQRQPSPGRYSCTRQRLSGRQQRPCRFPASGCPWHCPG